MNVVMTEHLSELSSKKDILIGSTTFVLKFLMKGNRSVPSTSHWFLRSQNCHGGFPLDASALSVKA
ncbi:hypothetical protein ACHAW6_016198 [Cyclotella cf. meneghiniana]